MYYVVCTSHFFNAIASNVYTLCVPHILLFPHYSVTHFPVHAIASMHFTKQEIHSAIQKYSEAVHLDPTFFDAYEGKQY